MSSLRSLGPPAEAEPRRPVRAQQIVASPSLPVDTVEAEAGTTRWRNATRCYGLVQGTSTTGRCSQAGHSRQGHRTSC